MDPREYQHLAGRTECDQQKSFDRYIKNNQTTNLRLHRLNHAITGIQGEAGELATALEKHTYYGQPLDVVNLKEEVGDCLWYLAELCNCMGFDLGSVMECNIAKLKQRYPDKYDPLLAAEENRDRSLERDIIADDRDPNHSAVCRESRDILHLREELKEVKQEVERESEKIRQAYDNSTHQEVVCMGKRVCEDYASNETMGDSEPRSSVSETEARRIANLGTYLCNWCKSIISDEAIRQYLAGNRESLGCPECEKELAFKDMQCRK